MAKKVKKRICFVQLRAYYLFNPDAKGIKDKVGGAQKQSYLYSIELAKHKAFNVHFVVADFGQKKDMEFVKKVAIWKSFNFKDNIFKKTLDLFKVFKKVDANFYIFRSADIGVAVAVFYVKIFLRKKVFYMLASDIETNYKQSVQSSGFLSALSMSWVYKFADIISVQSTTQYDLFVKQRNRKPDVTIRNIIQVSKKQKNKNKDFILWVGRLEKIKNPELFIELAKKHPDEKFIMIAPIVRDAKKYGTKIKENIISVSNIEYINFIAPAKIYRYYQMASIYVITSHKEGFSNTMAEAMANRCPILSFNVNPENIFTQHKTGYFAKGSKDLFFKKFEEFINNKNIAENFTQNALTYIKKHHDKDVIISSFIKLLK